MKKIINKIKRYKIISIVVLSIILVGMGISIGMYVKTEADDAYQFQSNEINFDGSRIGLSATNVKDAVDQIYELYQSNVGRCPDGKYCVELLNSYNSNIVKAYTYSATTCLTGNESGCIETVCYKVLGYSCPVGTIIDYKVNSGTTIRFHVLHDDGNTMTLQSQKNTVYNTAWYASSNDNSQGPTTIIAALKTATDSWSNVNDITITSSTSSFTGVTNIANSCDAYNSCSGNKYNMSTIAGTYKARLITLQEATNNGGCTDSQKSCIAFMNNYLKDSTSYCGDSSSLCENDTHTENGVTYNVGYWMLGAHSFSNAWYVHYYGEVLNTNTTNAGSGARAVVNISK